MAIFGISINHFQRFWTASNKLTAEEAAISQQSSLCQISIKEAGMRWVMAWPVTAVLVHAISLSLRSEQFFLEHLLTSMATKRAVP